MASYFVDIVDTRTGEVVEERVERSRAANNAWLFNHDAGGKRYKLVPHRGRPSDVCKRCWYGTATDNCPACKTLATKLRGARSNPRRRRRGAGFGASE